MKPNTTQAMFELIDQIKSALSMDTRTNDVCSGQCNACDSKLIDFISLEVEDWEQRLNSGEIPDFKDLSKLAKTGLKVHTALDKRGYID